MLDPYDMCERMYLVIKSQSNQQGREQGIAEKQEHIIEKGDNLKIGRTKLLVRDINIVYKNNEESKKKDMIMRRRKNFARRKHKEFLVKYK